MHPIQGLKFHTKLVGKVLDLRFHISGANSEVVQTFYLVHDTFLWLRVSVKDETTLPAAAQASLIAAKLFKMLIHDSD